MASEIQNYYNWKQGPIQKLGANRAYFQFLTHLSKAHSAGIEWPVDTLSEIGTGSHLGICFCALFSGVTKYQGFDQFRHVDLSDQLALLNDIHSMFVNKQPALNDLNQLAFEFPEHIISDAILNKTLKEDFKTSIEAEISRLSSGLDSNLIKYAAPYSQGHNEFFDTTDLLMSTATLEHVEDVNDTYRFFHSILRPGGHMSHSIDFRNHGYRKLWNGKDLWNSHWLLNEEEWKTVTKGAEYSINRLPASAHLRAMAEASFEIIFVQRRIYENELNWRDLTRQFRWLSSNDIECSGIHVISKKFCESSPTND